MKGNDVRRNFLEYFQVRGHRVVASSPLVPARDPSLLFTNAGMNQFKDLFLQREKRTYTKAASCQKCLRVSGKHNDLEQVGVTPRHHTFFEMLGNFSFGDYFKREAIGFAWDLLTGSLGLPVDRLWVSVFEKDEESAKIWESEIGVHTDRIIRLGEKDNFWQMGDTGPCGPCSEIHFDRGIALGCGKPDCGVACDCDRFTELWNLVFIEFNRDAEGNLNPLQQKGIDTGMGLERIVAVLQGVGSNYETDLFQPLLNSISGICGKRYGEEKRADISFRVIADHIRSISFLIADGVVPANDNRGYVLRRILRRAIRHGRKLGLEDPFLWQLTDQVVLEMGPAYPELVSSRKVISRICRREEERFRDTYQIGSRLMEEVMSKLRSKGVGTVPGDDMFLLYDTYGMPIDFQEEMAEEKGLGLDRTGFEKRLDRQRQKARKAWRGGRGMEAGTAYHEFLPEDCSKFLGYQSTVIEDCKVLAVLADSKPTSELREGQEGEVLLEITPFYPEGGGQVGDRGILTFGAGTARVVQTHSPVPGMILHQVRQVSGRIAKGDRVTATVDAELRRDTARNHTATHLLHAALRRTLGEHVKQAGSYVGPDRLRFDINHFAPIDPSTRQEVEDLVWRKILEDIPLQVEEMPIDDALAAGAIALFGEKYGDSVRVVRIGDFSVELCGGTHVGRTGEIGEFSLMDDSSISAGVRRLEAFSGGGAGNLRRRDRSILDRLELVLKTGREHIPDGVRHLVEQHKAQQKEIGDLRGRLLAGGGSGEDVRIDRAGPVQVVSRRVEGARPGELRLLADRIRNRYRPSIVILGTISGEKGFLNLSLTKDLLKQLSAKKILQSVVKTGGYRGGGRNDLAEAGGEATRLDEVLEKARAAACDAALSLSGKGEGKGSGGNP